MGAGRSFTVDAPHHVAFYERDVSELAQAKGANTAGLRILLRRYGIPPEEVSVLYLAGAFGRHMPLEAARRAGLILPLGDDRIRQVGNAALEGATIALRSTTRRRELDELVSRIEHVSLESDPLFFDEFTLGCLLRPLEGTVAE